MAAAGLRPEYEVKKPKGFCFENSESHGFSFTQASSQVVTNTLKGKLIDYAGLIVLTKGDFKQDKSWSVQHTIVHSRDKT